MPDHDLIAAQFADCHVATDSASIVVPIVNVKIAPIVSVNAGRAHSALATAAISDNFRIRTL
jgi:uncharacterized protein (DUF1786 family)